MGTPSEKLAQSLQRLKEIQEEGIIAIQSKHLTRIQRERLIKNGFLKEVMKGWYISTHPEETEGESTAWYASFWGFCSSYLNSRFKETWCLSPEQSLLIHAENWTVPRQLLVHTPKGNNKVTKFLHHTSLLDVRYNMPNPKQIIIKNGIRIFSLSSALIHVSANFFTQYPHDMRAVLSTIYDSSALLHSLLEGGYTSAAGRLCGAFRNIRYERMADDIKKAMTALNFDIRENDPFITKNSFQYKEYYSSPSINRLQVMWHEMRHIILKIFPNVSTIAVEFDQYLKNVEAHYVNDAYHSLSIEGYQVNLELIEKVRSGNWNPDSFIHDRNQKNALAARGYWQAFNQVKKSIRQVLKKNKPGEIVRNDHVNWYRELFQPSVSAGLLRPTDLAGYRNVPVYIRNSMYVPPNYEIVPTLMSAFFDLLQAEKEASVRIVLGHFFFVYIHPYIDGNGRMGRFLMNVMLASKGDPWTIIPVERRHEYMAALEEASVHQNIEPFTHFLVSCIYSSN